VFVPGAAVGATGVPVKFADDIVGAVPNTKAPVPVSSVTAANRFAEDGVPKNVATPVPKEVMPVPPEAAGRGLVKVTFCDASIEIASAPLVWILRVPVVSVVMFRDVAVVVPALITLAILSSRCRS
jgi:hypothetical protein